jgi:hypothetical protein
MSKNVELYREFVSDVEEILEFTRNSKIFPTQFKFTPLNEECYAKIYLNPNKSVISRQAYISLIPSLGQTCKECWKFYLSPRNKSVKGLDIQLGKRFEHKIITFLNLKGITCQKSGEKGEYPDTKILDSDGNVVAFVEIKYQSAPWIYAYKEEGTNRECYEGSPAIDTKKLKQQHALLLEGKINVPVFYLFWLDFPCIKGLFFIDIRELYNYYQNGAKLFERKLREGDFLKNKIKTDKKGHTEKIHPSIFCLKPIHDFLIQIGANNV